MADDTTFTERRVAAGVGKALRVEGRIISNEDLTIDGGVEGSIELGNHSLTIGPGAAVKADLTAKAVTISGSVTGAVHASGSRPRCRARSVSPRTAARTRTG